MSGLLPIDDPMLKVIGAAMNGVTSRQAVIANNIANAATPNFRAQTVSFEKSLQSAVARGSMAGFAISTVDSGDPAKQDGNSVNMTSEMTKLDESGLMFDALVSAMNFRLDTVRAALAR